MNLRPLHKLSPLNPPLHLLLLTKMIMHAVHLPLSRFSRGMTDTEAKVGWGKDRALFGEKGDYGAFAYTGGSADY
jgi:hypothetical protein